MIYSFNFKGNKYAQGTVVKIVEKHQNEFKFNSNLVFEKYDENNGLLYFRTLYSNWDQFCIGKNKVEEYISTVVSPVVIASECKFSPKTNEEYVDGIVSAWIWYIIIMVFGLFLQGWTNVIIIWVLSSVIFFSWRHKKMNGE